MKTKDNKKAEIGDTLYYAKKVNGLMLVHTVKVKEGMTPAASECYSKRDSIHFLCVAANSIGI